MQPQKFARRAIVPASTYHVLWALVVTYLGYHI